MEKLIARFSQATALILGLGATTLALAQGTKNVTLAWDHSSSPEVSSYILYYGAVNAAVTNSIWVGYETNYTLTGLQDNTTYFIYATAVDAYGIESKPTEVITHDTASVVVPVGPRITKMRALEYGMVLTWSSVAGRSYRVVYKDNLNDPEWLPLSEDVAAGGPLTTWADTEPGNGGRRFYSILVLP